MGHAGFARPMRRWAPRLQNTALCAKYVAEKQNSCHPRRMTKTMLAHRPNGFAPARVPLPSRRARLELFLPGVTRNALKRYVCDKRIQGNPNVGAPLAAEPGGDPAERRGHSKFGPAGRPNPERPSA